MLGGAATPGSRVATRASGTSTRRAGVDESGKTRDEKSAVTRLLH